MLSWAALLPSYYQRKLKEGTCKAQEMESAVGRLRPRKKLPYNTPQADTVEMPQRRVLRVLSRLKQQNYGEGPRLPSGSPLHPRLPQPGPGPRHGSPLWAQLCADHHPQLQTPTLYPEPEPREHGWSQEPGLGGQRG